MDWTVKMREIFLDESSNTEHCTFQFLCLRKATVYAQSAMSEKFKDKYLVVLQEALHCQRSTGHQVHKPEIFLNFLIFKN